MYSTLTHVELRALLYLLYSYMFLWCIYRCIAVVAE